MSEESCKRRTATLRLGLILTVGLAVLASACGFIVSETESALVLRFGKPVRTLDKSGFYLRLPAPIERVVRIDRRLQHADIRLSETLTKDQRNVIVPVFFTWKVADPLRFHVSVSDTANASGKLDALVTSARNTVLGRHPFGDLVAAEGRLSLLQDLEKEMLALAANDARETMGIELLSTGITQIQLPEANTESVFRRMRAERKREATQFRAEGRAKAAEMKAETDKQASGMIAGAKRQAEEIRGKAEAEAAAVYAKAHGEAPEFYRFLRELQSLRTVVDKNTTVVLDTSVAPFHWLKESDAHPPSLQPVPSPAPSQPVAPPVPAPALTEHQPVSSQPAPQLPAQLPEATTLPATPVTLDQ
ncbi:protease modulator HflC [Luteolibacter soli]|uniref:Protease modulator HflC n=1 Tax=Luteolibacter soli TaxID=3135280 RepID=A0ABU9AZ50_9BACT